MSVLEKFRSSQDSTFIQVIMALVILSFVGFMGQSGGDMGSNVATVNGVAITDIDHTRALRSEARMREATTGQPLTDAQADQLRETVRASLIEMEVLNQEATRLGIEVSDAEVAKVLFSIGSFKNKEGRFDEAEYLKALGRDGSTQDQFEQRMRDELRREKLRQLVFLGASTSDSALREAWIEKGTTVELAFVAIRPASMTSLLEITDASRAEWAKENEAQIASAYEQDKARLYDHPETVHLRMIRLATAPDGADLKAKLDKVRAEVVGGGDMEALARRWSEDPSALKAGDLGTQPVTSLTPDLVAAVADLQAGAVSPVFATATDVRFVRVEERTPAKVDAIEEVRTSIIDRLMREEKLPGLALDYAEKEVLAKWQESGSAPEDALKEKGLSVRKSGPVKLAEPGPMAPPAAILEAARSVPTGTVLSRVFESGGNLFVAQLVARVEPDPAEFDANKDQLREQLLIERRAKFYQAWVADRKAQAKIETDS